MALLFPVHELAAVLLRSQPGSLLLRILPRVEANPVVNEKQAAPGCPLEPGTLRVDQKIEHETIGRDIPDNQVMVDVAPLSNLRMCLVINAR